MSTFNTNQFTMSQQVGEVDLKNSVQPNITCRFNPAGTVVTNRLLAGEGVILADLGSDDSVGPPIVAERSADDDAIFGVRVFTTKQGYDDPGDITQIATSGSVVWMNAGAAVARGASVALVIATPGNVITRTTETILGTALDKASGANELIRVLIA